MPLKLQIINSPKKSKYKNKRCIVNGITFQSIREGKRYIALSYKQSAGEISQLKLQVPIRIRVNKQLAFTYKADFTYLDSAGRLVVEDAKGAMTPVYKLKKKLIFLHLGISISEV